MKIDNYKELANDFRKVADTLDQIQEVLDDKSLSFEEKDKKTDDLLGKYLIQMLKINSKVN